MTNRTAYTYDLLLKTNLFLVEKEKRKGLITCFLMGVIGITFILMDSLSEDYYWLCAGGGFFAASLLRLLFILRLRKSKVSETVKKFIQENPGKTVDYQFEENAVIIRERSPQYQSDTCLSYSFIHKVQKIDDTTFYFISSNNRLYAVEDDRNMEAILVFLAEKVGICLEK
ncbi:MAG: hypothetical protein IJW46_05795 [Clostridia bacterium]|nr:hypothetical protein [Clostridia bacterium]